MQQSRLEPDHSHHWLTDGTFSVMEGWLCHDGFPGCPTIWDLIDYLRSKFAAAERYKDKRVEVTCLLVTFAFTKWFDGCIHQDEIRRIGTPLVWRHMWSEEQGDVVVQYKMALSDEGSFEKDEWGPWECPEGCVHAIPSQPDSKIWKHVSKMFPFFGNSWGCMCVSQVTFNWCSPWLHTNHHSHATHEVAHN